MKYGTSMNRYPDTGPPKKSRVPWTTKILCSKRKNGTTGKFAGTPAFLRRHIFHKYHVFLRMSGPPRLPEIFECLLFPDHMVFLLVGSYTKLSSSLTFSCSPLSVCLSELIDFCLIFCQISRFGSARPGHFQILVSLKEGLSIGYDSRISYRLYIGMHVQGDKVFFVWFFIW